MPSVIIIDNNLRINGSINDYLVVPLEQSKISPEAYKAFFSALINYVTPSTREQLIKNLHKLSASISSAKEVAYAKAYFESIISGVEQSDTTNELLESFYKAISDGSGEPFVTVLVYLLGQDFLKKDQYIDSFSMIQESFRTNALINDLLNEHSSKAPPNPTQIDGEQICVKILQSAYIGDQINNMCKVFCEKLNLTSCIVSYNDREKIPGMLAKLAFTKLEHLLDYSVIHKFFVDNAKELTRQNIKLLLETMASLKARSFDERAKTYIDLLLEYANIVGNNITEMSSLLQFEQELDRKRANLPPVAYNCQNIDLWRFNLKEALKDLINNFKTSAFRMYRALNAISAQMFPDFTSVLHFLFRHDKNTLLTILKDPHTIATDEYFDPTEENRKDTHEILLVESLVVSTQGKVFLKTKLNAPQSLQLIVFYFFTIPGSYTPEIPADLKNLLINIYSTFKIDDKKSFLEYLQQVFVEDPLTISSGLGNVFKQIMPHSLNLAWAVFDKFTKNLDNCIDFDSPIPIQTQTQTDNIVNYFNDFLKMFFEIDLGATNTRLIVKHIIEENKSAMFEIFSDSPSLKYMTPVLIKQAGNAGFKYFEQLNNRLNNVRPDAFTRAYRAWQAYLEYREKLEAENPETREGNLQSSHLGKQRTHDIMIKVLEYIEKNEIPLPTFDETFRVIRKLILEKITIQLPDVEYSEINKFINMHRENLVNFGLEVDKWQQSESEPTPSAELVRHVFNNTQDELYIPAMRWLTRFKMDLFENINEENPFADPLPRSEIVATDFNDSRSNMMHIEHGIFDQLRFLIALMNASEDDEIKTNVAEQIVQQCSISQREVARPGQMESAVSCRPGTLGRLLFAYESHPEFASNREEIVRQYAILTLVSSLKNAMRTRIMVDLQQYNESTKWSTLIEPAKAIFESFQILSLENCIRILQNKPVDLSLSNGTLTEQVLKLRYDALEKQYKMISDFVAAIKANIIAAGLNTNGQYDVFNDIEITFIKMIYEGFCNDRARQELSSCFDQEATTLKELPKVKDTQLLLQIKAIIDRPETDLRTKASKLKNALKAYADFYVQNIEPKPGDKQIQSFIDEFIEKLSQNSKFTLEQLHELADQKFKNHRPRLKFP